MKSRTRTNHNKYKPKLPDRATVAGQTSLHRCIETAAKEK